MDTVVDVVLYNTQQAVEYTVSAPSVKGWMLFIMAHSTGVYW